MHTAYEENQEYLEKIWDLNRTDFDNILTLLKFYSGYWKPFSPSYWNQYAQGIRQVLSQYYGEKGYLKTDSNTYRCTKEYLISDLSAQLRKEYTQCGTEFLALVQVLKNHIGIDLRKCIELFQGEEQKGLNRGLKHQVDEYKQIIGPPLSLKSLFVAYVKSLPPPKASKGFYINTSHVFAIFRLVNVTDLIDHFSLIELTAGSLYCERLLSSFPLLGSKEDIRYVFLLVLTRAYHNYCAYHRLAYYLFCQYSDLEIPKKRSFLFYNDENSWDSANELFADLISDINKPIANELLLVVIGYIRAIGGKLYENEYVMLCNKSEFILNFSEVEKLFIEYFKPDYHRALFNACDTLSIHAVIHLLKTKNLTLTQKSWCRDSEFYRSFSEALECAYENDLYPAPNRHRIKTTPLLGMVMNALYVYRKGIAINYNKLPLNYDNSYQDNVNVHMEIIKLLIKHNPEVIKISDESGNIIDYLNAFKERVLCDEKRFPLNNIGQQIQEVTDLIYNLGYGYNKFRMFSQGTTDENSILKSLPKDFQTKINKTHMNMYP